MKTMRDRRRAQDLREVRIVVPDPRSQSVRQQVAVQVAALDPHGEHDAMCWIEAVSEFDEPSDRETDATR